MSYRDNLDRLDDKDQDRFDRYGYPDPPWMYLDSELVVEQEAFDREARYFDAPLDTPERVSDDWLDLEEAA